jgi:hypothetical protein
MDPIQKLLIRADPVLIGPYRWLEDPVAGWWIGTAVLALWCLLLGQLTLLLAYAANRRFLRRESEEMVRYHNLSMDALRAGDQEAFEASDRLARDAFGRSFFHNIAIGAAALWPLFFAAQWLSMRFENVSILLPGGIETNHVAPLVICFVLLYLVYRKIRPRLPVLRLVLELGRRSKAKETMRFVPRGGADDRRE